MGIVAKLSDCIASRGGNILNADVFVPEKENVFYSRRSVLLLICSHSLYFFSVCHILYWCILVYFEFILTGFFYGFDLWISYFMWTCIIEQRQFIHYEQMSNLMRVELQAVVIYGLGLTWYSALRVIDEYQPSRFT